MMVVMPTADSDHYAALGVAPDADADEIRAAWRFQLAAFHPDKFRDDEQRGRAEEITKRANAAWQVLGTETDRRRYDHLRETGDEAREQIAAARSIPCPSCATPGQVHDVGGEVVELTCPACRIEFAAMVGALCVRRPTLERGGWFKLRYVVGFRSNRGQESIIRFRNFPKELALTQGERFSVVFDPRTSQPVYAVNHAPAVDIAWKVG